MKNFLILLITLFVTPVPAKAFFWSTYKTKLSDGTRIEVKREDIFCKGPFERDRNEGSLNLYGKFYIYYDCQAYYKEKKSSISLPKVVKRRQFCYWSTTNSKSWSVCDAAQYFNLYPYKELPKLIIPY